LKEQLKATTKGHVSSIIDKLKTPSTRTITSSDSSNTAPKKRGRKSKAEKEELLRQQELLLLQQKEEDEIEDSDIDDLYDEELDSE